MKQILGPEAKHSENEQNCKVYKIMIMIKMTMFKQNCQKASLKCENTNLNARIPHTCFKSLIIAVFGNSKVTFSWLLNILQL